MTKCWNRLDQRPTFRYCLETLTQLHNNCMFLYPDIELSFPNDISYKSVSSEKMSTKEETSGEVQPKYLDLSYVEDDEKNIENMCEAPLIYSDNNQNNNNINLSISNNTNNNSRCNIDQGTLKDEGYEIPISLDNNLDINANNELNSNLSKQRTLSNSSTVSPMYEPNQMHNTFHAVANENIENLCSQTKILTSGVMHPQIKHTQIKHPQSNLPISGWV